MKPRFFACPLGEVAGRVRRTIEQVMRCDESKGRKAFVFKRDFVFAELVLDDFWIVLT